MAGGEPVNITEDLPSEGMVDIYYTDGRFTPDGNDITGNRGYKDADGNWHRDVIGINITTKQYYQILENAFFHTWSNNRR